MSITAFPITTKTIAQLNSLSSGTVDRANDVIEITDVSASSSLKITPNALMGISGSALGTTDTQTVSNKVFDNSNTYTAKDTLFTLQDDGDTTKQVKFQLSGLTTATTRTFTFPDATDTIVVLAATQTLTNKTLSSPTISGGTIDNSTVTVDALAGHTTANTGTVYGVAITSGVITGANTVGTAALAAGAVTGPKITLSYGFSAYSTTAQNSGNAAFALTNFQIEEYDIGANFASSVFTAPVTGYYHFDAGVFTSVGATTWIVSLFKNASEWKRGIQLSYATALNAGGGLSVDVKLTAADTVDVRTFGDSLRAINVTQSTCFFMGHFLGN